MYRKSSVSEGIARNTCMDMNKLLDIWVRQYDMPGMPFNME